MGVTSTYGPANATRMGLWRELTRVASASQGSPMLIGGDFTMTSEVKDRPNNMGGRDLDSEDFELFISKSALIDFCFLFFFWRGGGGGGGAAGAITIDLISDPFIPPPSFQDNIGNPEAPRRFDEVVSMERIRSGTEPQFSHGFLGGVHKPIK